MRELHVSAPSEGIRLSELIRRAGFQFAMPCNGNHTCGKCAVLVKGSLSVITEEEQAFLRAAPRAPVPDGFCWRMACFCEVQGELTLMLPDDAIVEVADYAYALPSFDGGETGDFGIAIDVGTTTVSALLYALSEGRLLSERHEMNKQAVFGADVLSRIEQANANGIHALQDCITGQIATMIEAMVAEASVLEDDISRMVITGNATMLHLLTGLDPRGIGVAPFTPASLFGEEVEAGSISALFPAHARVYIPRCIGAYVGADIACGLLETGMGEGDDPQLLVDVGTNGEMAVRQGGRLLCCATAAGPAFEGAEISQGMPATAGAITKLYYEDGVVRLNTIAEAKPIGLCGTGLISAIAMMIETGALLPSGRLEKGESFEIGDSAVSLTQQDIRNIQLAKAAIRAGIETLMHEAGLAPRDVKALYLCGGFGSFIDVEEAVKIGMIPETLAPVTVASGNTSLSGATRMLFSKHERMLCERIAQEAQELPLSSSPYFMDQYVEHMMFPEDE